MLMPTPTCPVLAGKIHAIGSCLKLYLRELEDPVLPYAQYDRWIAIGRSGTGDDDTDFSDDSDDEVMFEESGNIVRMHGYDEEEGEGDSDDAMADPEEEGRYGEED